MKGKEKKKGEKKESGQKKEGKVPNLGIGPTTSYSAAHVTTIKLPPPGLITHTISITNLT